ncbi:MAG TPA: LysM domain-containing protein [Kiritimatiellia bacterium]
MRCFLPMLLVALLSGCATIEDQNRQALEQQQDMEIMQDKLNKLQGRIEGLELEQQRIHQQLDAMPRSSASQIDAVQARVNDLDARIRAVDSAREKDKKDIIDTLSGKISQVVSSAAKSAPKQPVKRSAATSGTGYEHVVESGQTISEIAAAYKVRVSDVITANDLKDPNHLRVGQKLFIPAP